MKLTEADTTIFNKFTIFNNSICPFFLLFIIITIFVIIVYIQKFLQSQSYRNSLLCNAIFFYLRTVSAKEDNQEISFVDKPNVNWFNYVDDSHIMPNTTKFNNFDSKWLTECRQLSHSNYLSAMDLDLACEHRKMWYNTTKQTRVAKQFTAQQKKYFKSLEREREKFLNRRRREIQSVSLPETFLPTNSSAEEIGTSLHETEDPFLKIAALSAESSILAHQQSGRNTIPKNSEKAIRKEFRMLTNAERANLTLAMNALKQKMVDNISIWDLHTIIHYPESAVGAHWGPAFLPWHREFLRQFETALRKEVPGVALPYWDSTLDYGLPDPSDSVMWMEELMGNGNGYVKTGPFKEWSTNVLMPLSPVPIKKLFRSTGARLQDRLLSPRDVEWIVSRSNYSALTFCHDKTFESMHGLSHVWVGGFMFVIRVSPNDPTFYMHHAFIDYIWEHFRQTQQTRQEREKDYARKICNKNHGFNAQMAPFNLKNRDGMSNDYTDYWYEYHPVKHCAAETPFCNSRYLFCDNRTWRCRSRIQLGGNCTGFTGTEICYNSMCIQNVCRIPATAGNGFERRERPPVSALNAFGTFNKNNIVWTKTLLLGDDNLPLSSGIAHINVHEVNPIADTIDKDNYNISSISSANVTVFMQRTTQYPEIPGTVYVPLPHSSGTDNYVKLEARDHYGRYCQSYCLNGTTNSYQVCEPHIFLKGTINHTSSNISYTHSYSARRFLDMDMSVHPVNWRVHTPFIVFACHRKLINSVIIKENGELLSQPLEKAEYVWFRVTILKRTNSQYNLDNLHIESEHLDDRSDLWISSVRRARSTYDQSVVFVRAKNPRLFHNGVRVRVALREEGVRISCDVKCNLNSVIEDDCDGVVFLHEEPERSKERVFASDPAYLQLLGWRMVGQPSEWRLQMSYLTFYC